MPAIHRTIGSVIVAGFLLLLVWGAIAALVKRSPGSWFWRLLALLQAAVLVQVVGGVVLLAQGFRRPLLHLAYGALFPVLLLLVAHLFARGMDREEDAAKVFTVAAFFIVGLTLRAYMTGLGS